MEIREWGQWTLGAIGVVVAFYALRQTSELNTADYAERIRASEVILESITKSQDKMDTTLVELQNSVRELKSISTDSELSEKVLEIGKFVKKLEDQMNGFEQLNSVNLTPEQVAAVLVRDYSEEIQGPPGARGPKGEPGRPGAPGKDGEQGPPGLTVQSGTNYDLDEVVGEVMRRLADDGFPAEVIPSASLPVSPNTIFTNVDSRFPNAQKEGIYLEVRTIKRYTRSSSSRSGRVTSTFFLKNNRPSAIFIAIDQDGGVRYVDKLGLICGSSRNFGDIGDIGKYFENSEDYVAVQPSEEIIFTVSNIRCDNTVDGTEGSVSLHFHLKGEGKVDTLRMQIFGVKFGGKVFNP